MINNYFTDIHNHIIFSIDDGAENLEKSIRMIEQALDSNIRQIVATPHITEVTDERVAERIKKHFQELEDEMIRQKLPVKIFLATELYYNDRIYNWLKEPWVTFNGNQVYFLFELPLFDSPDGIGDFIFQIRLKGYQPILAHPERYIYLHNKLSTLIQWQQQGCLMQMNAGSITGQFGNEVLSMAKKLLLANFYSFAASDAHDIVSRDFKVLPKAFEIANDLITQEEAENLFIINPDKAIKGEPITQSRIDEEILTESWFEGIIKSIKNFKLH